MQKIFGEIRRIGGWGNESSMRPPVTGKSCSVFVSCVTCRACEAVRVCYPPGRGLAAISCPTPAAAPPPAPAAASPPVAGSVSRWCPGGSPLVSRRCPVQIESQIYPQFHSQILRIENEIRIETENEIDSEVQNEIEVDIQIKSEIQIQIDIGNVI